MPGWDYRGLETFELGFVLGVHHLEGNVYHTVPTDETHAWASILVFHHMKCTF